MKKDTVCLVTGGFDPIHSGHIEYLKEAKKKMDFLIVGINSDEWLLNKKGYSFMPWDERKNIIINLSIVDQVISFDDNDNSASNAISKSLEISQKVIFANGGDRKEGNIPELVAFQNNPNVEFIYGIGGSNKMNSSSDITKNFIKNYEANKKNNSYNNILKIDAPWGSHDTIVDSPEYKLKQLFVNPGAKLSLQYHHHRSEHWVVASGTASVQLGEKEFDLNEGEYIFIPQTEKHRISNNTQSGLIIIEVQCGKILEESDIVRLEDSFGRS